MQIRLHMLLQPDQHLYCSNIICCNLTLSLLVETCLLITFANNLDPDQDRQNVGPDLDPNCLTL